MAITLFILFLKFKCVCDLVGLFSSQKDVLKWPGFQNASHHTYCMNKGLIFQRTRCSFILMVCPAVYKPVVEKLSFFSKSIPKCTGRDLSRNMDGYLLKNKIKQNKNHHQWLIKVPSGLFASLDFVPSNRKQYISNNNNNKQKLFWVFLKLCYRWEV